ncbi:LysR family transcriptional regulator [Saccharopolyspora shandongensis]|uniref:LysR family transcriptional regulator n=1 Tax=Saccharopolyspora shandongensis TaxID=418495 RepID=UPI003433AF32
MRVRGLDYFLAVVEHGSFSEAALALGVSQSAVSQAISALEAEFGSPLFKRTRTGARLTPAGHELVRPARDVVAELAATTGRVRAASENGRHLLRIACPAAVASDILAPALGTTRRAHPSLEVVISDPQTTAGEDPLAAGEVDVLLTFDSPARWPEHRSAPVGPVEFVAVLPPGSDLPPGPLPVTDLLDMDLVLGPPGDTFRIALQEVTDPLTVDRSVMVEIEHRETIMLLVAARAGATVMPERQARLGASKLGLEIRALTPRLRQQFHVVHGDVALQEPARTLIIALRHGRAWSGVLR